MHITENKALISGYLRQFGSSNQVPMDIIDLIYLFSLVLIGSAMLTKEEEEQLINWIGKPKEYNFRLLFKATRDGFGAKEFHKKCDGKGATISIIKSENGQIFGGYTSKSWHHKMRRTFDRFAWLHSLRNDKGIPKKFKIVKDKEYAIYGSNNFGPTYGYDLRISNNCNENFKSYSSLGEKYDGGSDPFQLHGGAMGKWFKVLDYEVWQINRIV